VTGTLLRSTASHSIIAMRLAHILLHTLAPEPLVPGRASVFDRALALPAEYTPEAGREHAIARFDAYCAWIVNESRLLLLPVWEMKLLTSVRRTRGEYEHRDRYDAFGAASIASLTSSRMYVYLSAAPPPLSLCSGPRGVRLARRQLEGPARRADPTPNGQRCDDAGRTRERASRIHACAQAPR
jgi:hypothetical protein